MIWYCKVVICFIVLSSCFFVILFDVFEIVFLKINWSFRRKEKIFLRMVLSCLKINMFISKLLKLECEFDVI